MSEATSQSQSAEGTTPTEESAEQKPEKTELAAQVDLLAADNRRLRELLAERQRTQYQNTAAGLFGVGILCGILGSLIPSAATVLFALGGIGVFGGVLTYFLTPERFISADVGQRVYSATAQSFENLCADLGLSDRRIYVVATDDDGTTGSSPKSWLFIPQTEDTAVPDVGTLDSGFIVEEDHRGLVVHPTGSGLFAAIQESVTDSLSETPEELCAQLADAVVEDFELATGVEYDVDQANGRISVRFSGALYGDGRQFDHPVVSVIAVGLAAGMRNPVETIVTENDPLAVTFRLDSEAASDG